MAVESTILDQNFVPPKKTRRQLLPWWMKFFSWVFMIFGVFGVAGLTGAIIFGASYQLELYGIRSTEPLSTNGLIVTGFFLLKGIVGYALWFEKDAAIILGMVDALIGIIACIFVMYVLPSVILMDGDYSTTFRLELPILLLYLYKLGRLKPLWNW